MSLGKPSALCLNDALHANSALISDPGRYKRCVKWPACKKCLKSFDEALVADNDMCRLCVFYAE